MAQPKLINSLSRGAQILRLLADHTVALGVTEVADHLGVDPSTSYRLLATLETHGFVVQDQDTKKYTVGYGVLEVASALLSRLSIVEISRPHMRELAAWSGENTHVAVRDRLAAVSVGSESAAGILRVETTIGKAEPLHCTAIGKALLADYNRAQLAELFGNEPLHRYTPNTKTTLEELEAELARARAAGYTVDDEELHPGVRCIAAPVREHTGRVVAAFGLSSPAVRLKLERIPELASRTIEHARAISGQLGYALTPTAASP
jgi:IclR family transcriptional regulator, KDG regulon repressor